MRIGLGVYDALAGKRGIEDTRWLSRAATIAQLPGVKAHGLVGAFPTGTRSLTMRVWRLH